MIKGDYINLLWIASKTEKCYFTTSIKFSCLPQSYKKPFDTKYNFEISFLDKLDTTSRDGYKLISLISKEKKVKEFCS